LFGHAEVGEGVEGVKDALDDSIAAVDLEFDGIFACEAVRTGEPQDQASIEDLLRMRVFDAFEIGCARLDMR
jgi:hypothetical protein